MVNQQEGHEMIRFWHFLFSQDDTFRFIFFFLNIFLVCEEEITENNKGYGGWGYMVVVIDTVNKSVNVLSKNI